MELRVFVVEDLPGMQSLLEMLMAALGGVRVVGKARTEAEARLWLDENVGGWDVSIIDLVLDQGSGLGVIGHAKRASAGRVVVFSSYASPGIVAHCLGLGADAVFDKQDTLAFIGWLDAARGPRLPE